MNTAVTNIEVSSGEFVWEIRAWSALEKAVGNRTTSAVFECAGEQWQVGIYPGGHRAEHSEYVSVFLIYMGKQRCVKINFSLSLKHSTGEFRKIYSGAGNKFGIATVKPEGIFSSWGANRLKRMDELLHEYCANDSVCLQVFIEIQGALTSTVWQATTWKPPGTLSRDMARLWAAREETGDGTVVTGSERFRVHKGFVAIRSQRLHASFFGGGSEVTSSEVVIENFEANIVQQLLKCIYTDECDKEILEANPEELLQVGDAFGVDRMVYLAEQELVRSLTVENVAARLQLSDMHAVAAHLRESSIDYIHRCFDSVQASEGWTRLLQTPNSGTLVGDVLCETQRRLKRPREPLSELLQSAEGVKRMRVGEMRAELQRLGLDSTGIREVLEERLGIVIASREGSAVGHGGNSEPL